MDEKAEHTNRLTSHLKIYFPQMLNWFEHLDTELVCALLERWPALEQLQKLPRRSCGRSLVSTTAAIMNSSSGGFWRFVSPFPRFAIGR